MKKKFKKIYYCSILELVDCMFSVGISFSPDILSRSCLLGSGKRNTVSMSPIAERNASIRNNPDSPMDEPSIITLRNVPINAPVFPPAAEDPDPNPRILVGKTSGGYINVVTFGPNSMKK